MKNAVTGVNIIPTVLLALVLVYWMTVITGLFDFDFFDIDVDGLEQPDIFSGLFAFLNVAQLPFMLFFSIFILNFWILAMLLYLLPIANGGLINAILLIPVFVLCMFLTKYETLPLKGIFKGSNQPEERIIPTIHRLCTLRCETQGTKLGQAEVVGQDTTIVINVKADSEKDAFKKGEVAFIASKDLEKELYYIIKLRGVEK